MSATPRVEMIETPTEPARRALTPLPSSGLVVAGVAKRWGTLDVLAGVDLGVAPGERVWISGKNGAGKTTLLRIVSGLIRPDHGDVRVDGLSPESERREFQKRIGLQSAGDRGLYARLTARENLEFWARLALVPRRQRDDAVDRAIARFALEPLAGARVDRLSMGQRQRVRLAMTFLHAPRLLLLDEPRNSLDEEGAERLVDAAEAHRRDGGMLIWVSPKGERAGLEFDRHYAIEQGSLVSV